MDKATTLPRTRKETVVTSSSSSSPLGTFRTKTTEKIKKMPLIRRKKKKKEGPLEVPSENGVGGLDDTSSVEGSAPSEVSGELSTSTPTISTPSASPAVEKKENFIQKSPGLAKKQIKSLIKGGKNLFKSKNESAPIAVETSLDLHRSVPAETEWNDSSAEAADQSVASAGDPFIDHSDSGDGESPVAVSEDVVEVKDDWSVTATCKRVKKLSVIEVTRDSVYSNEENEKLENGSVVTALEQELISEAGSSYPPTPTAETPGTDNGDQSPMNFDRKSPSTLKKEIMAMTNRPSNENTYIMEKMRNRKMSLQVNRTEERLILEVLKKSIFFWGGRGWCLFFDVKKNIKNGKTNI